jgi:hypothetical protein
MCGGQLTIDINPMPAVRPAAAVVPARPVSIPPAVVRGVALLAVSTGVEWALRRMAGNAARSAVRSLIPGASSAVSRPAKAEGPREVSVDEILYVRKVQLRR